MLPQTLAKRKWSDSKASKHKRLKADRGLESSIQGSDNAAKVANIYRPLDKDRKEVRLLRVYAGAKHDPLRCESREAFLCDEPKPQYETISYVWGDAESKTVALVNGILQSIPASSKEAIQHMRRLDRDRVLWIDAICINQSDLEERGHQVGLMRDVYHNTKRNLIWLGQGNDSTAEALRLLLRVLKDADEETTDVRATLSMIGYSARNGGFPTASSSGMHIDRSLRPLMDFYQNPWFTRLWIVQEATLSHVNTCHIGPFELDLNLILRAAVWLSYKRRFIPDDVEMTGVLHALTLFLFADRNAWSSNYFEVTRSLYALLYIMRQFRATDPRDHVYAVLGLYQVSSSAGFSDGLLMPNYKKTVNEVLRDATRFIVKQHGYTDFLQTAGLSAGAESTNPNLPSWVYTPHSYNGPDSEKAWELPALFLCNTHKLSDPLKLQSESTMRDPNVLTLPDFIIGSVNDCSAIFTTSTMDDPQSLQAELLIVTNMIKSSNSSLDLYATYEPTSEDSINRIRQERKFRENLQARWDSLGRALICDIGTNHSRATKAEISAIYPWMHYIASKRQLPPELSYLHKHNVKYDHLAWGIARFHHCVGVYLTNRRFFVISPHRIGVGPPTMRVGDVVAILYSCRWPAILRREGQYYKVVGVAYVDGVMDNEAVQKHPEGGEENVTFHLR